LQEARRKTRMQNSLDREILYVLLELEQKGPCKTPTGISSFGRKPKADSRKPRQKSYHKPIPICCSDVVKNSDWLDFPL
jgi:hypothetical protein